MRRAPWVALLLATAACHHRGALAPNGSLDGSADGSAGGSAGTDGSTLAPGGASGGDVGGGGSSGAGVGGATGFAGDPGFVGMRRLSDVEYVNSLQAVLGLASDGPGIAAGLAATADPAPDPTKAWTFAFDNLSGAPGISPARFAAYFDVATAELDGVFASAALRARILTCAPSSTSPADETCARAIITAFGQRAWRRPLTAAEADAFATLARNALAAGGDFAESMRQVVQAMLVSESFLYRIEFDAPVTSVATHAITSYDVATRLSYLLWSTTPDDELLQLAAKDGLATKEAIATQANRLLADPRATGFVANFFGQWLGFRALDGATLDRPAPWSASVQASMATEARTFVSNLVQENRPLGALFTTDVNFVDGDLALIYGFPVPPPGAGLSRVVETTDARKGFLGLGAFLAATSHPTSTSATLRGQWVLERLLCERIPHPPAAGHPTMPLGTARAQFDMLSQMPGCKACHAVIDPVGFALEKFDEIGRFRTTYEPGGGPIDDQAVLSDGTTLAGLAGLADVLAANPRASSCASSAAATYAVGGELDATNEERLFVRWRDAGLGLQTLVATIVTDDTFRFRRGEGP